MKKIFLFLALFCASIFASNLDRYLDEAKSRCILGNSKSFLCDGMKAYSNTTIRSVSVKSDTYARLIMCSSFALATKHERYDVYEGTDVSLKYKSNGEIAWVLLTHFSEDKTCGRIARDILDDKYVK